MKNFKRFTAAIAATLMAASLSVPMAMNVSAATAENPITITITQVGEGTHSYTAYPIFTGTVKKDTTSGAISLESPTWANPSRAKDLVDAMLADETLCPKVEGDYAEGSLGALLSAANSETPDAAAVATALGTIQSNTEQAAALAKVIVGKVGTGISSNGNVISITQDGYYVVVDELTGTDTNATNTVVSSYILSVAGNENLTIDAKASLPTVDKQIQDETEDAETGSTDGWGETADHAIGEVHSFKLIATIPGNANLKDYDTYKLVFNDEMSSGLTFNGITDVKVGGTSVKNVADAYTETASNASNMAGLKWTLTLSDIISLLPNGTTFGEDEFTVEVEYTAFLNENATSYAANSTDLNAKDNNNKVFLEYSNNPNYSGDGDSLGKTVEDYVFDYCYTVNNIKKKNSTTGDVLAGAKFELHEGSATGAVINLMWNEAKGAYIPGGNSTVIESRADGTFNVAGLDAGTYVLVETEAPAGYNLAPNTDIVIGAEHKETSKDTPVMTLKSDNTGMNNTIVDSSGSELPSTGGMGTKLFFLGGGSMAAVAGIFLITKKRMGKNAE